MVIRAWHERLDHLVKGGELCRAMDLAGEFLQDQGKALVGLRGPRERRKMAIASKLMSILERHVDACVTVDFPKEGGIRELAEHYGTAVPPAVRACMAIKRKDVLFGKVSL